MSESGLLLGAGKKKGNEGEGSRGDRNHGLIMDQKFQSGAWEQRHESLLIIR